MNQATDRRSVGARTVVADAGDAGQRIDNVLLRRLPGVPRSHVYRIIRSGEVRINSARVKPTRKVQAGDRIRLPPLRVSTAIDVQVPDRLAGLLASAVVFEHEDFLVVAKPPGLAVHGGSGLAFGLIDGLRQALGAPALNLVHRLDRGTSGCLLVARDPPTGRALQTLFRERRIEKRYLAVVAGGWPDRVDHVDAPLVRTLIDGGERRVVVSPDGQCAYTEFAVLDRWADATLLRATLHTGRTHQIRVHAWHVGYPLIGDERYGNHAVNTTFRRRGLSRLFLHASELGFEWRGERIHVVVPVDRQWKQELARLRPIGTTAAVIDRQIR